MKLRIFFLFLATLTAVILTACTGDSPETAGPPTSTATSAVAEIPITTPAETPQTGTPTAEPSPTNPPTAAPTTMPTATAEPPPTAAPEADPLATSPDGRWRVVAPISTPILVGEDEMEEFPSGAKYQAELYVESTDSDLVWTVVDEWRNSGLGADYPGPLQWSADGRYLFFTNIPRPDGCSVFVNGGDLWRLDLQTGEVVQLLPFVGMAMALSPDSGTLAYYRSSNEANFHLYDLASGEEISLYLPDYGDPWQQIGGISWSPDGRHLLALQVLDPCGVRLTAVNRLDLDEGEFVTLIGPDERNFTLLNWLRDREIRLLDEDGRVWYLETNSGEIAGGRP